MRFERRLRRVERLADVGQRDVGDRQVQVGDGRDEDQGDQDEPGPRRRGRGQRRPPPRGPAPQLRRPPRCRILVDRSGRASSSTLFTRVNERQTVAADATFRQHDDLVHQVEALGPVRDQEHGPVRRPPRACPRRPARPSPDRGAPSARRGRESGRRRGAPGRARSAGAGRPRAPALPRRRGCPDLREATPPSPQLAPAQRVLDLGVGGPGPREPDVLADRRREQIRVLACDRDRRPTSSWRYSRRSRPARVTRPCSGSRKRRRRLTTVVLPEPLGPTSATFRPGSSRRLTPSRAGGSSGA